jgi:hypothetical protein
VDYFTNASYNATKPVIVQATVKAVTVTVPAKLGKEST